MTPEQYQAAEENLRSWKSQAGEAFKHERAESQGCDPNSASSSQVPVGKKAKGFAVYVR